MTALAVPHLWDGHQLVLASDRPDGAVAGWAARGVCQREKMLYAAPSEDASGEKLVASLSMHGVDAHGAADDGRLEVVEPARFYTTDGYTGLVEQAHREGYRGVRTFGGPDVAARAVSAAEFEEFERVADRMWAAFGVTTFCRYDPRVAADGDRLADAVAAHPSGCRDRTLQAYRLDTGELCLAGEVDSANDAILAALLSDAAAKAEPVLVVECSALTFMSVSAWRAAVNATDALRARGGRVLLSGVSPLGRHVLKTTGFDEAFEVSP
jgi:anti-anti-sigma factor